MFVITRKLHSISVYPNYPMTLYFQTQFNRVICTLHARKIIRNSIKNKKTNSAMKMKYHDNPEPGIEYKKRNIKKPLN